MFTFIRSWSVVSIFLVFFKLHLSKIGTTLSAIYIITYFLRFLGLFCWYCLIIFAGSKVTCTRWWYIHWYLRVFPVWHFVVKFLHTYVTKSYAITTDLKEQEASHQKEHMNILHLDRAEILQLIFQWYVFNWFFSCITMKL